MSFPERAALLARLARILPEDRTRLMAFRETFLVRLTPDERLREFLSARTVEEELCLLLRDPATPPRALAIESQVRIVA
jgi:hypothetical protein